MDPNSNLVSLRANVQEALRLGYSAAVKVNIAQLNTLLINIAEDFDNLDEWLMKGGFLPKDWQDARDRYLSSVPRYRDPVQYTEDDGPKYGG